MIKGGALKWCENRLFVLMKCNLHSQMMGLAILVFLNGLGIIQD